MIYKQRTINRRRVTVRTSCSEKTDVMKRNYTVKIKLFEHFKNTNRKKKSVRSLTAASEIIIVKLIFKEYVRDESTLKKYEKVKDNSD